MRRDQLSLLLALITVAGLGAVFSLASGTRFLMPGPLTSAHSAIEDCNACHAGGGSGKLSWIGRLVSDNARMDSKACLSCHKMPETAFNAHGAAADVLKKSTARLTKIAAQLPAPTLARVQSIAVPSVDLTAQGINCATCHQEHQGIYFNLNKISDAQCRSCHVVKFDSFDGQHPKFDDYPFDRRTRIIYDHAEHFGKHYPELKGKALAKHIPATCSTCHNTNSDKRIMSVASFDQTCNACHIDQITGKDKASGPKGVAFLTLPGLDMEALRTKTAEVGEWPEESEAVLTPFMKVMISRTAEGRKLVGSLAGINLQDLSAATDEEIKVITKLIWEIKALFFALISGKASEVLGDLNIVRGAKLSPELVADLTASIPRDVLIGAQQQWLPNLAAEMANGPVTDGVGQSGEYRTNSSLTETDSSDAAQEVSESGSETDDAETGSQSNEGQGARDNKHDPPACLVSILGQCLMFKEESNGANAAQPQGAGNNPGNTITNDSGVRKKPASNALSQPMRAGLQHAMPPRGAPKVARKSETQNKSSDSGENNNDENVPASEAQPVPKAGKQNDDLLFLSEEEKRAVESRIGGEGKDVGPADTPAESSQQPSSPVISLESEVDPESWAEYGGWYSQDYAIYYRPTGHKDKFVYSWLFLTGPQARKDETSPAAAVFNFLNHEDAPGSCTKCHSVDDLPGKGRVVNFTPQTLKTKQGRFTKFLHEPHFGVLEKRGCLHCHSLKKGRPYLKSYEHGDPQSFASTFKQVEKDLCQSCHNREKARQDCLLCHNYHVNDVVTPIINTKIPID